MFISFFLRKFLKVLASIFLFLFLLLYGLFYFYTSPKSDKKIIAEFEDLGLTPKISHQKFKNLSYRKLTVINDSLLPTFVFVHGAIGSSTDFIKYMKDSSINSRANFVSYDRIGYNFEDKNEVQESITFERDMLQSITSNLPKENIILVGYSYGGPIVLSDTTCYKKVILLAPAIYSKNEVFPWLLNFYNWKFTRWLVPPVWKQAAKEKLSHQENLKIFENQWNKNPNEIVAIHGENDVIVPFENSEKLDKQFPKDQLDLIQLRRGNHGLIWNSYEFIREQLILSLN